MADRDQLTTIQIDMGTRDDLRTLADADFRTMVSEIRWLVAAELARRNIATISVEEQSQPEQG